MLRAFLLTLFISILCKSSLQFQSGAPATRCINLVPSHGVATAQPLPSPYDIILPRRTIGNGEVMKVEIRSLQTSRPFSGFILQARTSLDPVIIDGLFRESDDNVKSPRYAFRDCLAPNTTVTHANNVRRESQIFEWEAPRQFVGKLRFHATIVESFDTFWVNQRSSEVEVVFAEKPTEETPIEPPTEEIPTEPTTDETPTTEPPPIVDRDIYEGCDETKTCFGSGTVDCVLRRRCDTIGAVIYEEEKFFFEMRSSSEASYMSFAFSHDFHMARSSVIECINDRGTVRAFTSFTTDNDSPRIANQTIIRLDEARIINGMIYCRVEREPVTEIEGVSFNLEEDKLYLLLASGKSFSPSMIGFHDLGAFRSNEAVLLANVSVVQGRSRTMLYFHASFMIVAWVGTTSIGIFAARFMKKTWLNAKLFGKDFWFVTHQSCMILTWLLTLAGFIIILVDSSRWSTNPHSILGTIAFTLCMIQPIGAFFRPGPKEETRPVFNFLHMSIGNLTHLMTIIAMFYAPNLARAQLPGYFIFILIAYVSVYLTVYLSMTVLGHFSAIQKDDVSGSTVGLTKHSNSDAPFSSARKFTFLLFTITIGAFVIALIMVTVLSNG